MPKNPKLQVIDLTSETFDFNAGQFSISGFIANDSTQWFSAEIACQNLALNNVSHAVSRLRDKDKAIIISNDNGTPVRHLMVTEPGLNDLIFSSRTPEAKQYKYWVFDDVLPSIRAHGGYISPDASATQLEELQSTIRSQMHKIGYLERAVRGHEIMAESRGIGGFMDNSMPDGDSW